MRALLEYHSMKRFHDWKLVEVLPVWLQYGSHVFDDGDDDVDAVTLHLRYLKTNQPNDEQPHDIFIYHSYSQTRQKKPFIYKPSIALGC